MRKTGKHAVQILAALCLIALCGQIAGASTIEIKDVNNFVPFAYNTSAYKSGGAFVGCGPTTGAMILNYFQNEYSYSNLLTGGSALDTAWALHGSTYMDTNTDGFGSVLNIKPGMENYVANQSPEVIAGQTHDYSAQVTIHVGPTNNPPSSTYDAYGTFGDAWTNDATFYKYSNNNWSIDPTAFYTQVSGWLSNGTAVWLTVNSETNYTSDGKRYSDHWIPLIGVTDNGGSYQYEYYDTWDTSTHWADIQYLFDNTQTYDPFMINYVRTVEWTDQVTDIGPGPGTVPEQASFLLAGAGMLILAVRKRLQK
jgi:hypothetical protein